MSDFYDISAKMKQLFPSNAEADRAALTAMANAPVKEDIKVDQINESVSVKKGSLPIDLDLQSFSKLAGINEKQKAGDQVRGSEPTPTMSKPGGNETPHPMKDRLVGDSIENDEESTEGIKIVPTGKDPMADLQMQLKRGMDLVSEGSAMIEDAQSKMKDMMSKLSMESKPKVKPSNESTKNSIKQELYAKLKASK
tara:strand:- start:1584 stop:2171 length:588 start_codon:yes stop_codon:yes gene_type:complete